MFAVLYSFNVLPDKSKDFIEGWSGLTNLIYEYENSFGSRLHKIAPNTYIAYAQWPDKSTWKNSGSKLPEQASVFSKLMKDCCAEIKTENELELVADLLKSQQFNK